MLVKCVANELAKTEMDAVRIRLGRSIHRDGPNRDLVVGQDYEVHAVEYRDGGFWYFIHTVFENDYPFPYPAEYFQLLDATIPSDWAVRLINGAEGVILKRLAFREWANDDSFYERLVEGDAASVAVFKRQPIKGVRRL
jgi:hypothetical protein